MPGVTSGTPPLPPTRRGLPLNTPSQDLPHRLGLLRRRMLHPTSYELAVTYFLEVFAGDTQFLRESAQQAAPHLLAVVAQAAAKALGRRVVFDEARVFLLTEHRFYHGTGVVGEQVVLFFYFDAVDTGIAALIPGTGGAMDVLRFQLTAGWPDPGRN